MVVGGSRHETLDLGFVLLGTRQQGVPFIINELLLKGYLIINYHLIDTTNNTTTTSTTNTTTLIVDETRSDFISDFIIHLLHSNKNKTKHCR
ncbi:unnamed protein product [Schistosoma mattheei]|uniref:Uncharacterized protein n=1 Tax=Schistosoma mattheei TaxID=31246 RepID=A0A183PQU6_9TREM|nr:unnamed protein product [Schistosoma mattheei]